MTRMIKLLLTMTVAFSLTLADAQESATRQTESNEHGADADNPGDDDQPITVKDYFRGSDIRFVRISPTGDQLAYIAQNEIVVGSASTGFHPVKSFSSSQLAAQLEWIGPSNLMVKLVAERRRPVFAAFTVEAKEEKLLATKSIAFNASGSILDPMPDDPEHVLFINADVKDGVQFANVYRLNAFKEARTQLGEADRLNKSFNRASWFVLDRNKSLFLALNTWGDAPQLYRRSKGGTKWSSVWKGEPDDRFYPVQLGRDDSSLIVLTDAETDRLVAAELDLDTGEFTEFLYEDPVTDIDDMVISERTDRPAAAIVNRDGLSDYVFFDEALERNVSALRELFPDQLMTLSDLSSTETSTVVHVTSSSDAGTYHFCSFKDMSCDAIGAGRPWLADVGLSATRTIEVPSTDGFNVFAFLTMPKDSVEASVPLIVMPHGGPIGVSDSRRYNPDVQWLAHRGYAVLRVNYRGSSGYGREFMSAGMRQWGRGIEDDIEASLDLVLNQEPTLDKDRVCIYGGSYGGYSALQSLVRSPERYQCAASFAGVSDLPLLFSRSIFRRDEQMRDLLIDMVGDPRLDLAELREYSPVYNYRRITKPVFLAHGTDDEIVDIEHSWRLERLLTMGNADVEMLVLDGVGHGFEMLEDIETFYTPLLAFFDKHLKAPVE